jgi:farnesyl-diphosphate farnesyltransferase
LARAADTIADTGALPPAERRGHLDAVRTAVSGAPHVAGLEGLAARIAPAQAPAERALLERLPGILAAYRGLPAADQARARAVLLTLTQAMLEALERFPAEGSGRIAALETPADLDRYTYMNAGCVGEFWTDMVVAHRPRCAARFDAPVMKRRGVRLGQGLQLTNVLRDLPRDLRLGRCYLPREALARLGLAPEALLDPSTLGSARPLVTALAREAVGHLEEGLVYTLALPRRELRLRLACAWPLLIGLATLARIGRADALLDPAVVVKVPRREVRRLLAVSTALGGSNAALGAYAGRLAAAARAALTSP